MTTTEIISIIGAISGILAVAGIIYGFGVKFSRLETKVSLIYIYFKLIKITPNSILDSPKSDNFKLY